MKILLLFIALCSFQCACSSQRSLPGDRPDLLGFSDLTSEITVAIEEITAKADPALSTNIPPGTP